ncbi:hypothetical protein ACIREE_26785 [Streptomyces sp. NPDC102467]
MVLHRGRIVQSGKFHELFDRPGHMRDLWLLQQDRDAYRPREKGT